MRNPVLLITFLAMLVVSCGGSPTEPSSPDAEFLPPNPDGMLLPGLPNDLAVRSTVSLKPTRVEPNSISGDLLRTRLCAILKADATVEAVNLALKKHETTIVTMLKERPMVTLKINAVTDEADALAKASALEAEGVFLAVSPGRQYLSRTQASPGIAALAEWPFDPSLSPPATHLSASRSPAAWNAKRAMKEKATVLLPGQFLQLEAHENIDALSFQEPNEPWFVLQAQDGNLGFHLAGLIGANYFDHPQFSGAHPGFDRLEILGVPIVGYDVFDLDVTLRTYLDDLNKNWVLATCLVRPDITPMNAAVLALMWQVDTELNLFLQVSMGGDTGQHDDYSSEAPNTSHWNMAGSYVDLGLFLEAAGEENVEGFYDLVDVLNPIGPNQNLITVGYSELSSDLEAPFQKALESSSIPDIETYGVEILGPCAPGGEEFDCADGVMAQTGSRVAAAHVAGVGAYLTSISPEKAPEEIRDILEYAGKKGQHAHMVDAYSAVLGLDLPESQWFQNAATPRVRLAILDVAGNTDAPGENGVFDDHDIRVFLDEFLNYEAERAVPGNELDFDFAPQDLNGDGWTGGESRTVFDLDANRILGDVAIDNGETSVIKDELSLTDLDILCYYAFSQLYSGDTERREEMLLDCIGGGVDGGSVSIVSMEPTTSVVVMASTTTSSEVPYGCDGGEEQREDSRPLNELERFTTMLSHSCGSGGDLGAANAYGTMNYDEEFRRSADDRLEAIEIVVSATAGASGDASGNGQAYATTQIWFEVLEESVTLQCTGEARWMGAPQALRQQLVIIGDGAAQGVQETVYSHSFPEFVDTVVPIDITIELEPGLYFMEGAFGVAGFAGENDTRPDDSVGSLNVTLELVAP